MIFKTNNNLENILKEENSKYEQICAKNYNVDIARGKPCDEQLDSVSDFFENIVNKSKTFRQYRNYGLLDGTKEAKEMFSKILNISPSQIIVGGNSSLNLMYDSIQRALQFGLLNNTPWNKLEKVKFLCVVPGYDRHFNMLENFGIEMINIEMQPDGPDMDTIEKLVANDDSIKGIWCVPKYSNPTGNTYSDKVVKRLASMKCAASDFRIFWDNAYIVHHLSEKEDMLLDIYKEAEKNSNEDRIFMFTSTSKITFPGAGVSCFASSQKNIKDALSHMKFQTIGHNKINQILHVDFINNNGLKNIMKRHADIIRPKFETIIKSFETNFGDNCDVIKWTNPNGGYFISVDVLEGCASRVGELCKKAGLTITPVGATYPYGKDLKNSNIRIAPTFTSSDELDIACEIFVCCVKIACIEKIIKG